MKSLSSSKSGAIIGKDMTIRGHISGDSSLTVLGNIEGEIKITDSLIIENGAIINATIESKELFIKGKVSGDLEVEIVTLGNESEVSGDIKAEKITLEEGTRFNGVINMDFDLPDDL